jgi:nicotinamide-nucleotide amidase
MEGTRNLRAEVISIGDELTSGARLDTNSQWISQQLAELGIRTVRHTTVGDDLQTNIDSFRFAADSADVVIISGGLGPTLDDLTRQAMAEAFGRELVLDVSSLETIRAMFGSRGREMPERNRSQAMFPDGSQVIPNPHGTAPGIDLTVLPATGSSSGPSGTACRFFALPGVPAEMKQMWHETVFPRLEAMLGGELGPLRHYSVKVFGIGESDVEVKLPDLIDRNRVPTVGITVSRATITLRIVGRSKTEADFQALIQPSLQQIHSELGELVFGEGDEELEDVVSLLLSERNLTMACVEIGAASWINDWMLATQSSADEPRYVGGIAFPGLKQAAQWLTSETSAHADDEIWKSLATQACQRFQTNIGLVVGVYPSRLAVEQSTAAFDFVFACVHDDRMDLLHKSMGGHPDVLGPRVAKTGLDLLRKLLLSRV